MSAVTTTTSFPNAPAAWDLPSRGKVAMAGLIIAESGVYTICLLSSSLTIHFAAKALERNYIRLFLGLWLLTILLGGLFLYGTAQEWHRLIYEHGLTISKNLFWTNYYSLFCF